MLKIFGMVFNWFFILVLASPLLLLNAHYVYQLAEPLPLDDFSLELLPDITVQKRSVSTEPSVKAPLTTTELSFKKYIPTSKTNTNSTTYISNTTDVKLLSNPELKLDIKKSPKLLGQNGTGQRKSMVNLSPGSILVGPVIQNLGKDMKTTIDELDDSISISKFTDKDLNETLHKHNITDNSTKVDSHVYYNSTFTINKETAEHYWVELSNFSNSTTHELLSSAHRRAATITLSFDFPFYGHFIKNVTLATGGFLYTGEHVHSWLAATQYIAPLMANFDTSLSNDSLVKYMDNGTAFTVSWEKVVLKDKANEGSFTFQATLHKNGDIVFVYKDIPLIVEDIKDDLHPVKIGLSDAYIIDSSIFLLRRKTIYEYHRVHFRKEDIKNNTVIYLKALPTCLDHTDCESCVVKKNITSLQCVWCPALQKCSSGVDRHRQAWLLKGCDRAQIKNTSQCFRDSSYKQTYLIHHDSNVSYIHDSQQESSKIFNNLPSGNVQAVYEKKAEDEDNLGVSGAMSVVVIIALLVCVSLWSVYAYRNPHTTSGQILIKYRPSQWRWRRGEARYTAATIHM